MPKARSSASSCNRCISSALMWVAAGMKQGEYPIGALRIVQRQHHQAAIVMAQCGIEPGLEAGIVFQVFYDHDMLAAQGPPTGPRPIALCSDR